MSRAALLCRLDPSKHKGLWGTESEKEKDNCDFDKDGQDPLHPGACEFVQRNAK